MDKFTGECEGVCIYMSVCLHQERVKKQSNQERHEKVGMTYKKHQLKCHN